MNNQAKIDEIEIDIVRLLKLLLSRSWIVIIAMVVLAAILFWYAVFFITPLYQSTAMMYVNNSSFTVGSTSFSISSSELSAARTLLDLYVVILKTRVTLEEVIDKAGLDYEYEQLYSMVSASSVNGTEVFRITVTSPDPDEAELIVNTIVEVLPDRISEIVDGSSVRLVDHAVRPIRRSSPSYTRYATIGMVVGLVLSCAAIIVVDLMDTTVRNEEYLNQKYSIPILAVVPDAHAARKHPYKYKYGYYGRYYKDYSHAAAESKENTNT